MSNFKEQLKTKAKEAFTLMQANHPNEQFYTMVLATSNEMRYLYPTGNILSNTSPEDSAKWNVGDWCIFDGKELFDGVNELIRNEDIDGETLINISLEVLKELKEEGVFGKNQNSVSVYINLVFPEQCNEDLLYNAEKINSAELIEKLKLEWDKEKYLEALFDELAEHDKNQPPSEVQSHKRKKN